MGRQEHRNVFLPNEIFRSSSDVVYADWTFKSEPKLSHQYLQLTDSATYTTTHFHFFYRSINIKRHMGMYSDYCISGCKIWCGSLSNNSLRWLRNCPSQRDNSVARLRS